MRNTHRVPFWRALLLGGLMLAAAGCERFAPAPTATPAPTVGMIGLPTDTPVPLPSETSPPPTPDFIATAIAGATAKAAAANPQSSSAGQSAPGSAPTVGCEIPRKPELWRLAPGPDAPVDTQAAWLGEAQHKAQIEVVEHRADQRQYLLKSVDPALEWPLLLSYDGAPLPLVPGRRYRLSAWSDRPGDPPAGAGLRIDDEAGPVFLGLSLRETTNADARVLGGDRAGFTIEQQPTQCAYTELTPCGVELRAAPLAVGRDAGRVTLGPGKSAEIPGTPPYRVTVLTSHYARPVADMACPDRTDWVRSLRIERAGTP